MPYGGTIDQLNEVILSIEQQLAFYKQIDQYLSRVNGPDEASIEITFKEAFEEGRFPYELKKRLETIAVETGSAEFSVYGVGQGFSNALRGNPLNDRIQLLGYNYAQLWQLAEQAKDLFLQHLRIQEAYINAELTYYAPNETYFLVRLPEVSQLQQNKLSPSNIGDLLQQSREEALPAASLLSEGNTYSINLLTDQKGRSQLWNLRNAPYLLDSSQVYKHGAYLQLEQTKGQQKIVRVDQQYQLVLAYDFIGNYELGREVMEQKIDTLNQNLPLGYEVGRYGRNRFWDFQRNQSKMIGILGIALVVIFMINAILFNSLRQAFVPLLLIIPGFIGIFLTVYFFNFRFDQGGFAAFLLVAGLSVNAGLLLINDYNNYRFRYPKRTAIKVFIKAFNSKIIPIVLTALSTILGLLPFILFESHEVFWYALAMCSIGGMICSTLAVYLFFPILFLRRKDRFADLKSTPIIKFTQTMIRFLIYRPVSVVVIYLACCLLAIWRLGELPASLLPDIDIPEISILVEQEGFTALEIDNRLLQPLRQRLLQVGGINRMESSAGHETGVIRLRFNYGRDIDYAFLEVNEKVDLSLSQIPEGVSRPRVVRASAGELPAFYLSLSYQQSDSLGSSSMVELSDFADQIVRRRLEQLEAVALVDINGLRAKQIVIRPRRDLFVSLGLDQYDIQQALETANLSLGTIRVKERQYEYIMRLGQPLSSVEDIRKSALRIGERVFTLEELAEVRLLEQPPRGTYLFNGQPGIKPGRH
jgi:multidrug efflux pump subunit AcrB